jgi:hypothetical protein
MLLVQLEINSTRDVWIFAKLDSPRRLVQFWQNFQTSLVLLIPNCTCHRMITNTNKIHDSIGKALRTANQDRVTVNSHACILVLV